MTVRLSGADTVVLDGVCAVEDAEQLLQLLQAAPAAVVDWRHCRQLHTAVFQVILALGIVPLGPCGDVWAAQWLDAKTAPNGGISRAPTLLAAPMEQPVHPAIYPS